MAVDQFIDLGDIAGESQDKTYSGKHDVLSWSWNVHNTGSAHQGGGAGTGKVSVGDLSYTTPITKGLPSAVLACMTGKHIPTVTLYCRKAGGKPLVYLTITMSEVLITSVRLGGTGNEERQTTNISLNFAKVKVDYVEQKSDGTEGDKPTMTYNIAQNSPE